MATYDRQQLVAAGLKPTFELLIGAAENGTKLSYARIATVLEGKLGIPKIFSIHVGWVAGSLMDRLLEVDDRLPLINLLVVDNSDHIPGTGADYYLRNRYGPRARNMERKSPHRLVLISEATNEVYHYSRWRQVYRRLFGTSMPKVSSQGESDGQGDNPKFNRGLPESEEHKALKRYVHAHPRLVVRGATSFAGKMEFGLPSGDRLDVFFASPTEHVAVEVKSRRSNWDDMRRGIFQCVKYEAVLNAQNKGLEVRARAMLILEQELPSDLATLARSLGVQWKAVTVRREAR